MWITQLTAASVSDFLHPTASDSFWPFLSLVPLLANHRWISVFEENVQTPWHRCLRCIILLEHLSRRLLNMYCTFLSLLNSVTLSLGNLHLFISTKVYNYCSLLGKNSSCWRHLVPYIHIDSFSILWAAHILFHATYSRLLHDRAMCILVCLCIDLFPPKGRIYPWCAIVTEFKKKLQILRANILEPLLKTALYSHGQSSVLSPYYSMFYCCVQDDSLTFPLHSVLHYLQLCMVCPVG